MKNIEKTMELMSKGMTISKALKVIYKTRKVSIPFTKKSVEVPLSQFEFSNRVKNCFAQQNFKTWWDVINYFDKYNWRSIRNFGAGSALEVFEKMLDFVWSNLTTKERAEFLARVDEKNEARE